MRYAVALSMSMMFGCESSLTWDEAKEMVRRDFPEVEHISADELKRGLEGGEAPLLLDVREEAEYRVSHLPAAVRVPPGSGAPEIGEILGDLDRETPIVAYCSVGYRSSALVKKLEANGFTNVKNLEGSIFEWANRGLPVERGDREVREVHPFDERWGVLLDEDLHAYEPSSQ